MKALAIVSSLAFSTSVFTTSLFAQNVTRSFGSVVFPGGTSSTTPGISRNFGSAVFPGSANVPVVRGGAPAIGVFPGGGGFNSIPLQVRNGQGNLNGQGNRRFSPNRNNNNSQTYVYAYPVYVGGSYDNGYAPPMDPGPPPQQAPPPQNITVVYPPTQRANPVMIQAGPDGEYYSSGQRQGQGAVIYDAPRTADARTADTPDQPDPTDSGRYLIAFRDHTIYSAIAYWTDGDTLHYFTSGNTHNQVSVSLIDRTMTERLNKEIGSDFKLPPAK